MHPGYVVAFFVAAGLFMLGVCAGHIRRRRPLAAVRSGGTATVCLALAGLLIAIGFNLYTYRRLTYEQPVATVAFQRTRPQHFVARIRPAHAPARSYDLVGDEWQLDARVLKWTGVANLLGLDARYRLERISGRYARVRQTNSHPGSAHDLAVNRGLDLWRVAERYPSWLVLVDAGYGSAAYLPMADGARFRVSLSQSGLVARPDNAAARAALRHW